MAQQVTNLFEVEYQADVKHIYQRMGSYLKPTVRTKNNVVGSSTKFNRVGKGTASTKSRHGQVPPMNADRTQISCTLEDWYAGDWFDELDGSKTEVDETMVIAKQGAMALGRKSDELIISALDGTSNTGSWTLTNKATVENSAIGMLESLWALDVPNDGKVFAIVTPRCWSQLMKVQSFSDADYVGPDGSPFKSGPAMWTKFKDWMGAKWQMHVGLTESFTGTTAAARKIYAYHGDAVGFAIAKNAKNIAANEQVMADITWHGDHVAWFINHCFSAGACLIDGNGVVENTFADSTAIVTS